RTMCGLPEWLGFQRIAPRTQPGAGSCSAAGACGVVGSRGVIGTSRRGVASTSLAVITLAGDGPGGLVAVTVAVLGVFAGDVAVLLALLGELGVVLVGVQVAFQLLGAALLLGGGVALLLL